MPIIIERDEYTDAMNANFCGGVSYACDQIEEFMKKKRTVSDIKKFVENLNHDATKMRKTITISKKVINKATILH